MRSDIKSSARAARLMAGKPTLNLPRPKDELDGLRPSDRILIVASHLFAEKGFHGVTIRDIALGARCQLPALYREFENKEAIYLAACDMVFGQIARRYIFIMNSDDTPEIALFRHVVAFYRDLVRDDRVRKLLVRETLFNDGATIGFLAKKEFVPTFKALVDLCKRLTDRADVEQSAFEIYTFAIGYIQMASLGRAGKLKNIKWDNPNVMARRILYASFPEIEWDKVALKTAVSRQQDERTLQAMKQANAISES